MAIRFYDQAVAEKFSNWVGDRKIKILSPSDSTRLFQMLADENSDGKIDLPLIAISRDSDLEILNTHQNPMSYSALQIAGNEEQSLVLNAIPIKLSYQVDIYSKYLDEADEYLREFIFKIINTPSLIINIPYNDANYPATSTMILDSNVSDNSDIKERLIRGQFTRLTLKFSIVDAYLWSVPFMDNWKIRIKSPEIVEEEK